MLSIAKFKKRENAATRSMIAFPRLIVDVIDPASVGPKPELDEKTARVRTTGLAEAFVDGDSASTTNPREDSLRSLRRLWEEI